jgi:hypothetical protein
MLDVVYILFIVVVELALIAGLLLASLLTRWR